MKIFLTSVTSLIFIFLTVKQYMTVRRTIHPDEEKMKLAICVDLAVIFHILSHAFAEGSFLSDLLCCIVVGLMSISVISMTLFSVSGLVRTVVRLTVALELLSGVWLLLSSYAGLPEITRLTYMIVSLVSCGVIAALYIWGIYTRLKDVKYVMKSGSVWTNVTLSIDSIYLALILLTAMLHGTIAASLEDDNVILITILMSVYTCIYVAFSIRILNTSAFIIMTDHERRIIESMKISHTDNSQESAGTMMLYKNLYDRVLDYFTECKPYLNPNLTINDVVEVVFSNKLYISKAISQCTGRNFCQFVNYYRVIHAVELFREDTNLKVIELATKSGFNSVVSFGMAFKLYMGEKPGDWCRREKFRLDKLKK